MTAFEHRVLKPIQLLLIATAIATVVVARWWWLGGAVVALFYLGIVGSKLHPLQTASDLAAGPTTSNAALAEALALPSSVKAMLVGHGCTRVGFLSGIYAFAIAHALAGTHWGWSVGIALFVTMVIGASLKLAFHTVPEVA